jgi:hypothetical protein
MVSICRTDVSNAYVIVTVLSNGTRWLKLCIKNAQKNPMARAGRASRILRFAQVHSSRGCFHNISITMSESSSVPRPSSGDDPNRDDSNNWILLNHCDLRGMNIIVDPATGNVVAFSTRYCRDGERWKEGGQMPSLMQQNGINFSTVQTLDLHNSRYLVELNAALGSQLPQLRRVLLTRCDRLERLPESLSSLQYLEEVGKLELNTFQLFTSQLISFLLCAASWILLTRQWSKNFPPALGT